MVQLNRRQFLQVSATTLCGVWLAGCSNAQSGQVFDDNPDTYYVDNHEQIIEETDAIPRTLHIVGLEKDSKRFVKHCSLGMCQRLGLAIALLANPELIILDEPTNGLDPSGIHEMRELLRSLPREYGITFFLSSHLLSEVEQMATYIGIIRKGKLLFQGTPDALRRQWKNEARIRVEEPEAALQVLRQHGYPTAYRDADFLIVPVINNAESAEICTQLVNTGIRISELNLNQPSLEEIFLQTTAAHSIPISEEH